MIRSFVMTCAALALPVAAHAQTDVPPVAPAPTSVKGVRPTPPGNPKPISPASWVTNDDYPAAAIRAYEYGTVGFKLNVDATGKVTGCTIIASSGSALLDSTACRVLSARARFEPAVDQQGKAIPSIYQNRFRWELPAEEQPFESWAKVIQFDVSPSGEISHCSLELARIATRSDVCGQLVDTTPEVRAKLAGSAGPITVELRNAWRIDGSPAVIAPDPAGATTVFRHRTHFEVNAFGDVSQCQVLENTGKDIMRLARFDCRENVRFPALPDGDKTARWVTTTTSMTTRPAAPGGGGVPQRYTGTPLTAIAAGSWVTPDDYPAAALRAEEAGKVRFRLEVSGSGVPTNCAVIASSGSVSLDETTCSLLLKRARFVGARGPGGDPLATSYVNQVLGASRRPGDAAGVLVGDGALHDRRGQPADLVRVQGLCRARQRRGVALRRRLGDPARDDAGAARAIEGAGDDRGAVRP